MEKAKQDQRQKIIQAEGEAEAAKMVTVWTDCSVFPQTLYPAAPSVSVIMRNILART